MTKRTMQLWSMLIMAIVMMSASMAMAAPAIPPKISAIDPTYPTSLYPEGIGFNPVVDYRKPQFAQSPNIRKFIDKLPGLMSANQNSLGQYIPVANPDTTTYPGSDYYEIGLAQYSLKMHTDLPPTLLRGYYQKNTGTGLNPLGVAGTDHSKNYLGPAIIATRDKPVRIKFFNELLPGTAGNLPIPVDETIMGAGMGPVTGMNYTQNRADLHLHGSLSPWISDGTPHQWITPANDPNITDPNYQKGASFMNVPDMVAGPTSIVNGIQVPCANINGNGVNGCFTPAANDGIGTYFHPNVMSSRLMFYHDHSLGITRLNVYAGEAAPYLLTDNVEKDLINGTNVTGVFDHIVVADTITSVPPASVLPGFGTPLVFQDKTFVNGATTPPGAGFPAATSVSDMTLVAGTPAAPYVESPKTLVTDPLWKFYTPPYDGVTGSPDGSLWIGHEYLPVENPYDPTGNTWNGRWDYAPFMIPAMLPQNLTLPSPTIIPEGFQDTAVVNGTAFPYVELPPDATRFRMLNACNDRSLNLQLYKADPLRINVTNGGSGYLVAPAVTVTDSGPNAITAVATAVLGSTPATADKVVRINVTSATGFTFPGASGYTGPYTVTIADPPTGHANVATATPFVGTEVKMVDAKPNAAFPTWPRDGRDGGVPDPTTAAPPWYQIGNEAGFLAKVAVIPQQPIDYNYDRQVIPLVGVTSKSLLLMPAMRADVIIDLSGYSEGDMLIVYNDAPAAMPNYWPINDYFTDAPDNTGTGGAPTTPAGFGPNSRTMMQIRIKGAHTTNISPLLMQAIPSAFKKGSDPIIVPQVAYNEAYPTGDPLHYTVPASGSDNIVQGYQTTMNISGAAQGISQIRTIAPGNNYLTAPTVVITGGNGSGGAAKAGLNPIGAVTLLTAGSGYVTPPTITLGAPALPLAATPAAFNPVTNGIQATAATTVSGGIVNAISIVEPGAGYTNIVTAPTCTISAPPAPGVAATCSVMIPTQGQVGSIVVTAPGSYTAQPLVFLVPAAGSNGLGASADARIAGDLAMTGKNLTEGFDVEFGRMDIRLGSTPNPLTPTVGAGFVLGLARYIDPPTEIMNDGEVILWRLAHLGVDSHSMHFHLFNMQVINHVDWTNVIKPRYDDEIGWRETIRTNPMEDIIVAIKPVHMALPFPIPNSNRVLDPSTPLNSTTNFFPVAPPAGIAAVPQQSNVMTNFGWEYVWHCHLLGHEENDMMRPLVLVVPPPLAPTLTAVATTATNVNLSWASPINSDPAGYIYQRSTTATFTAATTTTSAFILATAPLPKADTVVANTANYYYRVQAINGAGTSAWSNVARVSTRLTAPTALVATVNNATSVTLNWTSASQFATGYTIQRSASSTFSAPTTIDVQPGTTVTKTDLTVVAGTRYYYRVRAYTTAPAATTAWSNTVTVIMVLPPTLNTATAGAAGSRTITLGWTNNAGATTTGYSIQRATNATFTAGLATTNTTTPATVSRPMTGLTAGRLYYFRVAERTALGNSTWSNTMSQTAP
jgi:FtsP/CotA-like multicopper oxidase with cupredoxin domain